MKISKLLVSGGIHGNEYTGVYIVNRMKKYPLKTKSLKIIPLLANPEAFRLSRRYKDQDLNRSFSTQDLHNSSLSSYENQRAREIYQLYGAESESPVDFLVDLHTTTSNLGKTVITDGKSPLVNKLCAYLVEQVDGLKVIKHENITSVAMNNIVPMSLTIEIGAVSTSIYDPNTINVTTEIVNKIIEFIEQSNCDNAPEVKGCKAYEPVKTISYPRDNDGNINAVIHKNLQGKDFQALNYNDPIFELMDGNDKFLDVPGRWYPIFINESAYYEKDIAFYLTKEVDL
ncbi:aspartoacylase [Candidatus Francisella endociliophora]|uniref:Aspartoacylase n=1 Tax=Candidatus Francisella endociliophora TaxID=653937 RepID=A0A097ERW0_9GAMM|nr:aspartoacylase [Francisella sp. FSC1006]AIT10306.1 aspartoacylase [Francisella sp. FSC1006]